VARSTPAQSRPLERQPGRTAHQLGMGRAGSHPGRCPLAPIRRRETETACGLPACVQVPAEPGLARRRRAEDSKRRWRPHRRRRNLVPRTARAVVPPWSVSQAAPVPSPRLPGKTYGSVLGTGLPAGLKSLGYTTRQRRTPSPSLSVCRSAWSRSARWTMRRSRDDMGLK